MTKVIIAGLLLSELVFANCTKAENFFAKSRDESNVNKKVALIKKAQKICKLPQIDIEMERLKINHLLKLEQLEGLEIELNKLKSATDTKDGLPYEFRFNTKRQIQEMFKRLYMKQKNMRGKKSFNPNGANIKNLDYKLEILGKKLDKSDMKSLDDIGGLYQSNLKFLKNKSAITNFSEAKELKAKMREIIADNPNALFSVTGYASSEGDYSYNEKLSKKRAETFVNYSGHINSIKAFHKGEAFLICFDELIPEEDENNEYRCINGEDRDASRRVEIRRVR